MSRIVPILSEVCDGAFGSQFVAGDGRLVAEQSLGWAVIIGSVSVVGLCD